MAESAISAKPLKAVAGWFAIASDRQLWGIMAISCFRPEADIDKSETSPFSDYFTSLVAQKPQIRLRKEFLHFSLECKLMINLSSI